VDTDQLPAVQYLILEVLAARWRTGEYGWTFPARLQRHLDALATLGLIGWKKPEPTLRLAWLTDAGRAAALSDKYAPRTLPGLSDEASLSDWLKYRGLPATASIRQLVEHERANATAAASFRAVAAQPVELLRDDQSDGTTA